MPAAAQTRRSLRVETGMIARCAENRVSHAVIGRLEVVGVELRELETIQLRALEETMVEPELPGDELVGYENVVVGRALVIHRPRSYGRLLLSAGPGRTRPRA